MAWNFKGTYNLFKRVASQASWDAERKGKRWRNEAKRKTGTGAGAGTASQKAHQLAGADDLLPKDSANKGVKHITAHGECQWEPIPPHQPFCALVLLQKTEGSWRGGDLVTLTSPHPPPGAWT